MEPNATELWRMVESLQLELSLLRANVTSASSNMSANAHHADSMGTDIDAMWLMLGCSFVVFMQAGFAMLEVGCAGAIHIDDILVKNLLDLAVAAGAWWAFGWGISFGEGGENFNQFVGPGSFFTRGVLFEDEEGNYGAEEGYNWARWLFQWSFSGTAVTIVSGAVGARMTMAGYVFFAMAMGSFIYPVIVRWVWNVLGWASPTSGIRDDLLFGCGALDFAGSGVVHATGGIASVVMCVLLGPHLHRFSEKAGRDVTQDNTVIQTLGGFILWMGWYGFNGCSTMLLTGSSHVAAKALVSTTVSASSACLGVTSVSLVMYQDVDPSCVINGVLSGLVAISASCAVVEVEGACFIGFISAINYLVFSRLLEMVRVDDMVDAAAVHLTNGAWGLVAAGLFTSEAGYRASYHADRVHLCCGWMYGCGTAQLKANLCFLAALLCWSGFTSFLVGYSLRCMGVLRISNTAERTETKSVAQRKIEVPASVANVLSKIEALVVMLGPGEEESESSSRGHHALSRFKAARILSPQRCKTIMVSSTSPSRDQAMKPVETNRRSPKNGTV